MQLQRQALALPPDTALCIGAFDGLHLGHRALLERATQRCSLASILTFEPHPAQVLAPERAPPQLQSPQQRARIAAALGVHTLATLPFNLEVAAIEADEFVRAYLIDGLAPQCVVVGQDFRFGARAAGDSALLRTLLEGAGIELQIVEVANDASGEKIGSSEIRKRLVAGDIAGANRRLGYDYALSGVVRHGAKRGRQLGFPTANISADSLCPQRGVYCGWLSVHEPGTDPATLPPALRAVANLGSNPTFDDGATITTGVEVHAIDAQLGESLYDREVEFAFVSRLRDERRFDSVDALRSAIADDVQSARTRLASADPSHRRPAPLRP